MIFLWISCFMRKNTLHAGDRSIVLILKLHAMEHVVDEQYFNFETDNRRMSSIFPIKSSMHCFLYDVCGCLPMTPENRS